MGNDPAMASISIGTRTIRKVRMRILPYILLLYIISFLDRLNIGFAALTMNQELKITSQQFGFLVGIFFVGYSILEIPSNLILHKIGARIWIARILIVWGIVAALTGFVHTVHQLYVARFALGVAEAGYYPGILLYLTYWFRRQEQAQAIALFMTAIPITNILGSPISGLILDHVHWFGLSSWRWLLILEGLPAVLFGLLTFFLLPSRPSEAKFLTDSEKDWITAQLKTEEAHNERTHQISAAERWFTVASGTWQVPLCSMVRSLTQYSSGCLRL
jgi:ACS family tartrate transporter-like MFS transporter